MDALGREMIRYMCVYFEGTISSLIVSLELMSLIFHSVGKI